MRASRREEYWTANAVALLDAPILLRSVLVYPDLHADWPAYRDAVALVGRQLKLSSAEKKEAGKIAWQLWCFHDAKKEPPEPPEFVHFLVSKRGSE